MEQRYFLCHWLSDELSSWRGLASCDAVAVFACCHDVVHQRNWPHHKTIYIQTHSNQWKDCGHVLIDILNQWWWVTKYTQCTHSGILLRYLYFSKVFPFFVTFTFIPPHLLLVTFCWLSWATCENQLHFYHLLFLFQKSAGNTDHWTFLWFLTVLLCK